MKRFITIINYCNIFAFGWLLVRAIFSNIDLPYWFTYGGLYLFFVTWVIEFIAEKRWQNFCFDKKSWCFILLMALFAICLIYAPFDGSVYFKHHLEYRYPLVGFGLVGLFGLNRLYKTRALLNTLIFTALGAIIYVLASTNFADVHSFSDFINAFQFSRVKQVSAHMNFNFYLNVALASILYITSKSWKDLSLGWRLGYSISGLLLVATTLTSEGRIGFAATIIIITGFVLIKFWNFSHKWCLIITPIVLLCGVFALSQHKRLDANQVKGDARFVFWHNAMELIEKRPILGYGMSSAQEEYDKIRTNGLSQEYIDYWDAQNVKYVDTHSQYIQITLEFGIIGLLLVLIIYAMPIIAVESERKLLALAICGLSAFQSITDMFITGSFCLLFCALLLILLRTNDNSHSESIAA